MATKTAPIKRWKPEADDIIVGQDGKLFVCYFDKVFHEEKLSIYNKFILHKDSYSNQLPTIVRYINFFEKFYDTDKELPAAYLAIKFALDKNRLYTEEDMDAYIDFLYQVLFRESMVEKIYKMAEENYLDDIDTPKDDKRKYKFDKKHLESLEFTNEHVKGLLRISMAVKIAGPAILHYTQLNGIQIKKGSDILFRFYKNLFEIFKYANTYDLYDSRNILIEENIKKDDFDKIIATHEITTKGEGKDTRYYFVDDDGKEKYLTIGVMNLYNKLYVYIRTKILQSNANNSPIFAQREIFGQDLYTIINFFVQTVIISENLLKYKFPETWDPKLKQYNESVIGFNKTIISFQLGYFIREKYAFNINEVTSASNTEGLSGSDKFMMNQAKLDEGAMILSDVNIKTTIDRIRRDIDIAVSEEEIDYYAKYQKPSKLHIKLVTLYYTKYFGSYNDLNLLTRREYILLSLLLKKKLLLELGFSMREGEVYHAALPYILTSNLSDKISTRIIRNNNFIAKMEENYLYKDLMENRYSMLRYIKPDEILKLFSSIINSKFSYVTYEYPDLLGAEIFYNEDTIGDELAFFLDKI